MNSRRLRRNRALGAAGSVLIVGGLGLLAAAGFRTWRLSRFQESQLRVLRTVRAEELEPGPRLVRPGPARPPRPALAPGVVGMISIPRLGISAVIKEGADSATLSLAVGHIPGTARFGEPGNVGVAAHRNGLFKPLQGVAPGDTIEVMTPTTDYHYTVEGSRVVRPEQVEVLSPTERPTLTLVTCYPFRYVGFAPKRFIVTARRDPAPPATRSEADERERAVGAPHDS
ncbi:MAG TPA: class D sortase [Thermoanaerobaculaceae bacterium]|nr:class D sortase [Thermoanaerobaculaceae bacterium]